MPAFMPAFACHYRRQSIFSLSVFRCRHFSERFRTFSIRLTLMPDATRLIDGRHAALRRRWLRERRASQQRRGLRAARLSIAAFQRSCRCRASLSSPADELPPAWLAL